MYVYIFCEYAKVYTVGFYDPDKKWNPESDWTTPTDAGDRVHYLNGGNKKLSGQVFTCPDCGYKVQAKELE